MFANPYQPVACSNHSRDLRALRKARISHSTIS
jgi:hypothetical protein